MTALEHATRRMLQSLDGYWEHCDGLRPAKRNIRGRYELEDWWSRFEKYRAEVESLLALSSPETHGAA